MGTGCQDRGFEGAPARGVQVRARVRASWVARAVCAALATTSGAALAGKPARPPAAQGSFSDVLAAQDATRWTRADGWANGSPFDNAWLADHIAFGSGLMDIRLDNQAAYGQPYSSGEYRTLGYYGYGCYEASFKAVGAPGVVTSFFTFAGPYDNGGNGKHNEIDIEILGNDTWRAQLNFWANDDTYASRNETLVNLPFNAAAGFHAYAFKWTSASIAWFIDGALVHEVFGSQAALPKASESLHKIMMNVWPVDDTASQWAGTFVYNGPLHGGYDWVRYTAGEDCTISATPPSEPPPTGGTNTLHVQQITLALGAQASQVIAKVSMVDYLGRPVAGAAVSGAWSGVITGGDTSRTTDSAGIATFYSARSRATGNVEFCVRGATVAGLSYESGSNLETCDSITK